MYKMRRELILMGVRDRLKNELEISFKGRFRYFLSRFINNKDGELVLEEELREERGGRGQRGGPHQEGLQPRRTRSRRGCRRSNSE